MSLCVAASGNLIALAASAFSLTWTHSVEKTEWVENWVIVENRLHLEEAKVTGSGAGIGLPDDAVWRDGAWTYRPGLRPLEQLSLAASGATPSPWTLCTSQTCLQLGEGAEEPIRIWAADPCILASSPNTIPAPKSR